MALGILSGANSSQKSSDLILQAGNAENEKERYKHLLELYNTTSTEQTIKRDLDKLLPLIDDWANGKEKAEKINDPEKGNVYLMHFLSMKNVNLEHQFPEKVAPTLTPQSLMDERPKMKLNIYD